jgi:hypothetical protein
VINWWPEPAAGDIVWCFYPTPEPKFRPALILAVFDENEPHFEVKVAYGTSQKTDRLFAGEFVIHEQKNAAAYIEAGLSYSTKFNFNLVKVLPFNDFFFAVPSQARYGNFPKLGILHPSMLPAVQAAYSAVSS